MVMAARPAVRVAMVGTAGSCSVPVGRAVWLGMRRSLVGMVGPVVTAVARACCRCGVLVVRVVTVAPVGVVFRVRVGRPGIVMAARAALGVMAVRAVLVGTAVSCSVPGVRAVRVVPGARVGVAVVARWVRRGHRPGCLVVRGVMAVRVRREVRAVRAAMPARGGCCCSSVATA